MNCCCPDRELTVLRGIVHGLANVPFWTFWRSPKYVFVGHDIILSLQQLGYVEWGCSFCGEEPWLVSRWVILYLHIHGIFKYGTWDIPGRFFHGTISGGFSGDSPGDLLSGDLVGQWARPVGERATDGRWSWSWPTPRASGETTRFFFFRQGNSRVGEGQSGNGCCRFVLEDYDYYLYDYITLYYELINSYIPSGKLT